MNNARDTQIESYLEILNDGTIAKCQYLVLKFINQYGPSSANEINRNLGGRHNPRITEMVEIGLLIDDGTKIDFATKKRVTIWALTGGQPVKPAKKKKSPWISRCSFRIFA